MASEIDPDALAKMNATKAAALLLAIGPASAAHVLRLLPPSALSKLMRTQAGLEAAPSSLIDDVSREFVAAMEGYGDGSTRGIALREIVEAAVGRDGVKKALEAPRGADPGRMRLLLEAEEGDLAMLLDDEHPSTVAVVLSLLPADKAAAVMGNLPAEQRPALLRAMCNLSTVSPEVIDEIVGGLSSQVKRFLETGKRTSIEGNKSAVALMRKLSSEIQRGTLDELEQIDSRLAEELRGKLIAFEDIASLPRKEIQAFLQTCDSRTLALALKGAPERVVDGILSNMSQRAAAAFREEMEMLGRVRLSQVEAAQADLIKVVLKLADEGKVTLVGPSENMV
jgi:flagellar motor switch protein FliG